MELVSLVTWTFPSIMVADIVMGSPLQSLLCVNSLPKLLLEEDFLDAVEISLTVILVVDFTCKLWVLPASLLVSSWAIPLLLLASTGVSTNSEAFSDLETKGGLCKTGGKEKEDTGLEGDAVDAA